MEVETQNYLVKAVIGLLQEAVPFGSGKTRDQEETHRRTLQVLSSHDDDGRQENNKRGVVIRHLVLLNMLYLLRGQGR